MVSVSSNPNTVRFRLEDDPNVDMASIESQVSAQPLSAQRVTTPLSALPSSPSPFALSESMVRDSMDKPARFFDPIGITPLNAPAPHDKPPQMRIKVPRASLRNALGNGLYRRGTLAKLLKLRASVLVEAHPSDRADRIFYAPFAEQPSLMESSATGHTHSPQLPHTLHQQGLQKHGHKHHFQHGRRSSASVRNPARNRSPTVSRTSSSSSYAQHSRDRAKQAKHHALLTAIASPFQKIQTDSDNNCIAQPLTSTQFVNINPESSQDVDHLVYSDHDFEISFVGMSVPPQDTLSLNGNELLLYSLRSHVLPDEESDESDEETGTTSNLPRQSEITASATRGHEHQQPPSENGNDGGTTLVKRAMSDHNDAGSDTRELDIPDGTVSDLPHSDATPLHATYSLHHPSEPAAFPLRAGNKDERRHTLMPNAKPNRPTRPKVKPGFPAISPSVTDPNGVRLLPSDVPLIHYDPVIDGHNQGSVPNSFIPVPASKSLYRQHRHEKTNTSIIPVRFSVMEIDKISPTQAATLSRVDSLQTYASQAGTAIPYVDIVSTAVGVANSLGRHVIRNYARPDHVISSDFEFYLASPQVRHCQNHTHIHNKNPQPISNHHDTSTSYAQPYLRYGYYFFLAEQVDARLYAQTDSSQQNVPLLLRRSKMSHKMARKGEKEFFPLSNVPYVVMKVRPGITKQPRDVSVAKAVENRARLEHVLRISNTLELLSELRR